LPAVPRASCPRIVRRDALTTTAGTAALQEESYMATNRRDFI